MKRQVLFLSVALFFSCILSSNIFAQTIGKMFTKTEADILFGKVIESVSMKAEDLSRIIEKTEEGVMFKIKDGKLLIKGDNRKALYPEDMNISETEVFAYFSKVMVMEIINSNTDGILSVENRKETLTITNGANTLEYCADCPPICY